MIVEKGQHGQMAIQQRHLQAGLLGAGFDSLAGSIEDEDADNDEENIVIDMQDEDEDDETELHYAAGKTSSELELPPCQQNPLNNNHPTHNKNSKTNQQSEELNFTVGDLIWFDPNQLGYSIPGKVLDYYPDLKLLTVQGHVQGQDSEELQVYSLSEYDQLASIRPRHPLSNPNGLADLVELDEITPEAIIWNLKLRLNQELVYTNCGHRLLVSVNPFKQLCDIYNIDQVKKYDTINTPICPANKPAGRTSIAQSALFRWLMAHDSEPHDEILPREPHIFALANDALKRLLISGQDQCFVLLGDSGSGKTEATKLLVQYLASVNKSPTNLMTEQILESMQVLESFGNAKTTLNDNSSRFGKILEIRFDLTNGFILDAKTNDLNLLDRTRIVSQSELERNYHVFYELLAGLSSSEKEKYGLQTSDKYFYLNQGHCLEMSNKEDGEDFRSLLASMQVLGFNHEEQDTIFRLLASILHLGNIYFHRKVLAVRSGKLAQQQQRLLSGIETDSGVEGVEIGSDTEVRWVSHLLQIQFDSVMRCLTVRTTETGAIGHLQDKIVSPLNIDQALDTRDAIARALYSCLFKWLIQRINAIINGPSGTAASSRAGSIKSKQSEPIYLCRTSESLCEFQPDKLESHRKLSGSDTQSKQQLLSATISILDAFGFEDLTENNFEQLCINYAAELIHYHTGRYLLRLEQVEYAKERLKWTPINLLVSDHASTGDSIQSVPSSTSGTGTGAIVNLISKKPLGILALLDDECNFPKATDQSFVEKCHHNHTLNDNYQRARLASNNQEFGIRHFRQAQRLVWYQIDGFVEKNRDSLRPDIVELLVGSNMSVVADMLKKLQKPYDTGTVNRTLSRTFDGRYVSMKPRAATVAARFQDALNNNQVLESINCSASEQLPSENAHYRGTQRTDEFALEPAKPGAWFVVCLKPNRSQIPGKFDLAYVQEQVKSLNLLELVHIRKLGFPIRMRYGEFVRRYKSLVPQKFLNSLASCQDIQSASHESQSSRRGGKEMKRAIKDVCGAIIEFVSRSKAQQLQFQDSKSQYQCGLTKMFLNEQLYHKLEQLRLIEHKRAILLLQRCIRMWLVRRHYIARRRAAIVIQAQIRGYLARAEFWRQYTAIVRLQRRWRHQLVVRRRQRLEAKRRAQRHQQQIHLQELQAQQRKQANQFRFRTQPVTSSQRSNPYARSGLEVPEELAQLYRYQRDWNPVHDLSNLNELDLVELIERERRRVAKHKNDNLSVPFVVVSSLDKFTLGADTLDTEAIEQLIREIEANERYSLQNFLLAYFTLESPQFGYSRLPITRPFSWRHMMENHQLGPEEFANLESKAIAIYKLILRYIDSDLSESPKQDNANWLRVIKFKLIADYIIYLCLAEIPLRDELYLQLSSQSWQNPNKRSTENVWRLMANCLGCFPPSNSELVKYLVSYVSNCCSDNYRKILLDKLAKSLDLNAPLVREQPTSLIEYRANQEAIKWLALSAGYYLDEAVPMQPEEDSSLSDASTINHSNRTLVLVGSHTTAEQLASGALRARNVPEANLAGWSVEIEHEGAQSEFSCRLRGHDQLLDHLARVELLPELSRPQQEGARRNQQKQQTFDSSPTTNDYGYGRRRKLSAAEFSAPPSQVYSKRNSMVSQRSYELNAHQARQHYGASSELDLSVSSRLSQSSRFNHRYPSHQHPDLIRDQHRDYSGRTRRHDKAPEFTDSMNRLHRRSISMQELQLAHLSAMNSRFQPLSQVRTNHYASNYVNPQSLSQRRNSNAGSLQQISQLAHHHHSQYRRRSQTPNSMMASNGLAQHRMSSSAYGSVSHTSSYMMAGSEVGATSTSNRRHNGVSHWSGSLTHNDPGQPARRYGSSSKLGPRGPTSEYASSATEYDRIGVRYPGQQVTSGQEQRRLTPAQKPVSRKQLISEPRYKNEMLHARQARPLRSYETTTESHKPLQVQHLATHYMSSAMSDTSEAPSMASHVRGVKVPQNNGDLDQYLDDLFNPMLNEADLDELSDARSLATSIRGTDSPIRAQSSNLEEQSEQSRVILSPTFESLLESLQSQPKMEQEEPQALRDPVTQEQQDLGNMDITQLKALNQKLEDQIQAEQSRRSGFIEGVPVPPPMPNFDKGSLDDSYSRSKTVRVGKWQWPPASYATDEPYKSETMVPEMEPEIKQQNESSNKINDAKLMPPPPPPTFNTSISTQPPCGDSNPMGSVGKLKISSEMKAKLEQLTNSGTGKESAVTPVAGQLIEQAKSMLLGNQEEGPQIRRLGDQRRKLLEKQLAGVEPASSRLSSDSTSTPTSGSKVMTAKLQLAAAAGVALAALDNGSRGSSRRQSTAIDSTGESLENRQSRVLKDELGPKSRAAISQREAFYQFSSNDEKALPEASEHDLNSASEATIPAPNEPQHSQVSQERQAEPPTDQKDPIYGQSVAKTLAQRHQETLSTTVSTKLPGEQWVVSSPDPAGSRRVPRAKLIEPELVVNKWRTSGSKQVKQPEPAKPVEFVDDSRCLVYANVDWQVKIRKEFFLPDETYEDPLVVQLIFAQLVADVFNPRHWTRLNCKERTAIKALMKDNSIGYAPSLPPIGQMQLVKQELVRMARSFGLYFTRPYPALNSALSGGSNRRPSSLSGSDDELDNPEVIMRRLRRSGSLGTDWIDMVAVHHSGLRLVILVESSAEQARPLSGELGVEPPAHSGLGYRVIETLKYRDLGEVAHLGQNQLLLSMRNGKKSWLISSNQANQLGSLLRYFHANYKQHIVSGSSVKEVASRKLNENSLARNSNNNSSSQQTKRKATAKASKDAILASDDGHYGNHIQQRQTPDRVGRLHQAPHSNNDLADGDPVLSRSLAHPTETNTQQHQLSAHESAGKRASNIPTEPAAESRQPTDCLVLKPDSTTTEQNNKTRKTKKNLWQNSLSRMSNKFSIFSGSQASRSSKSNLQAQQQAVQLDSWIETKVDFDDDDHEPDLPSPSSRHESLAHERDCKNSIRSKRSSHSEEQANKSLADEGKFSLLQYALYNFREAIDKYSLESCANKVDSPGDTSTLRGSLKLIETLRSSRSAQSSGSRSGAKSARHHLEGALGPEGEWTWRELAEMVKFTRTPIKQSLLKLPSDELSRRAVDCFLAVMEYMGDAPKRQLGGEVECVYLILMNCHNYPILCDEVYCQLMKQTTNNRSPENDSCLRGWRLFSIVAAYFDCSSSFRPYLVKYLETAAYDKRRAYCSVASLCLQNLRKTFKYNGRKNVPSIEEIAATSAGRNSKRQIYRLPGGTERVINTKSTTVVEDIIHDICSNMLNVTDPQEMLEFSLYCIADGDLYTMPLNRDEYILDITTELIKNHQQYFLIFCRSIWHYPLRLDSKLYIEVIYNQIAPDYLEGLLLVLPALRARYETSRQPLRLSNKLVKEIARIGALLHRASGTDYMPQKDQVKYLLPKPIIAAIKQHQRMVGTEQSVGSSEASEAASGRNHESLELDQETIITTPQNWFELIKANWREMSAFDTLDAKAQFLDIIRHWPLFGSSFFAIKLIQRDLIQPMDFILALNKLGVQMLDMTTHETIHRYTFNEVISTRKVRSEDGALFLDLKCGNLLKRTIIRIQTDQAHEISRLIRQYIDIELQQQKQQQPQINPSINHLNHVDSETNSNQLESS